MQVTKTIIHFTSHSMIIPLSTKNINNEYGTACRVSSIKETILECGALPIERSSTSSIRRYMWLKNHRGQRNTILRVLITERLIPSLACSSESTQGCHCKWDRNCGLKKNTTGTRALRLREDRK